MMVARPESDVLVATDGGYAKRTSIDEYRIQGRGGLGIRTARITEARGRLVGALNVQDSDEVLAITSGGGVIRTRAAEVRRTGRDTMGVRLVSLAEGDSVVAIARNAEASARTSSTRQPLAPTRPTWTAASPLIRLTGGPTRTWRITQPSLRSRMTRLPRLAMVRHPRECTTGGLAGQWSW